MNFNVPDAEDQQLNNNMQLINSELCSLIEETETVQNLKCHKSGGFGVLQEINHKLHEMNLDADDAPEFEFHGYGCTQSLDMMPKRLQRFCKGSAKKKSRSCNTRNDQTEIVSQQKQNQLQKENLWNQMEHKAINIEKRGYLNFSSNGFEQNSLLYLMELFKSLHCIITSELPSNQLNSVPSDYIFDLPKKCSMASGFNMRHQVQVLCTKLERFLVRLRRKLEENRNFDYSKYTECDVILNAAFRDLWLLKKFTYFEMRHRSLQFCSQADRNNAKRLGELMVEVQNRLKSAHINVHVFNWEMDLEHRYSAAMTARREATFAAAIQLAASEALADPVQQFSIEDQFIAEHYQLGNVVSCVKEHENFLNALLQSPNVYFPPEIVALCDPPKDITKLFLNQFQTVGEQSLDDLVFGAGIVELAPSSPPRTRRRSHVPICNRAS